MTNARFSAIFGKELHHLLPLIFALLALDILGWLIVFRDSLPDTLQWSEMSAILTPADARNASTAYVIIGFVAAYLVFPHERKNGTISVLWSLPVARWKLFCAKAGTAWIVLILFQFASLLSAAFINSFNVNSIDRLQFTWLLWWLEWLLTAGVLFIGLGIGLLASCFGLLGAIAAVVYLVMVSTVQTLFPAFGFLDPASLLVPEYHATQMRFSMPSWGYHLCLAVISTLLAGRWWTRHDEAFAGSHKHETRPRVRQALWVAATVVVVLFALANTLLRDDIEDVITTEDRQSLQVIHTEFYRFSHYTEDLARAQLLQRDADELARALQAVLGIALTGRVTVDLTAGSGMHMGIAGWKTLRMQRSALYNSAERAHVLAHETAHVLASMGSDRRLKDHMEEARFFSEGLAEWAAYEVLDLEGTRLALRTLAAVAWQRLDLEIDDLLAASRFAQSYDENLVYALGEAWVAALADVCGKDAPGAVVRSMAARKVSKKRGVAFWNAALSEAGCGFDAVNAYFTRQMDDAAAKVGSTVPVVRGGLKREDGKIKFSVRLEDAPPDTPFNVIVRLRENAQVAIYQTYSRQVVVQSGESKEVVIPGNAVPAGKFQYQLGVEFKADERPYFGRWIDAA